MKVSRVIAELQKLDPNGELVMNSPGGDGVYEAFRVYPISSPPPNAPFQRKTVTWYLLTYPDGPVSYKGRLEVPPKFLM